MRRIGDRVNQRFKMALGKSKIFVTQPYNEHTEAVYELISNAAAKTGASVFRWDTVAAGGNFVKNIHEAIKNADLIIADVSEANGNVMYEAGVAHATGKPLLLVARSGSGVPFDLAFARRVFYDPASPAEFTYQLAKRISEALKSPGDFVFEKTFAEGAKRQSVFISYSHKDKDFLDRLLVHLRPLEKQELIDLWVDTRLKAGDRWKKEIEKALNKAKVAILLVSADFLASDFITDNELPPILRNAEERGARIIPVIVKPCRFTRDENLKHFQAINDPNMALMRLSPGDQELVYDRVAAAIEDLL